MLGDIIIIINNYLRAPFSSLTINSNEYNTNKKNKNNRRNKRYNKNNYNNYLSSEILGINFKKENKKPQKSKTIRNVKYLKFKKIECEVCNEMFFVNRNNKVEKCGHAFCSNCWYDFLSIKIKENNLPSIKCLKYNCKEKLNEQFIIRLLKSNKDLIMKYKRYKLELEIINDPNKKLCPYPNCDSYLELKQIRNKDVKCKNRHTFCFECLKKPHGKLPCNANWDKSMKEYAMNNFVKKCPKCSIITEKNNGCNHIICTKCEYQWCWLCNQEYNANHFLGGKCKGFQFFQPKNEYEIKLMMEGKINYDELSENQRQYIINDVNHVNHVNHVNIEPNEEEIYNSIECSKKALIVFIFLILGKTVFILNTFDREGISNIFIVPYILLFFALFIQMIFLNILSFLMILIFIGFKKFILNLENFIDFYVEKVILILVTILLRTFCKCFYSWKNLFNDYPDISDNFCMKFLYFFHV